MDRHRIIAVLALGAALAAAGSAGAQTADALNAAAFAKPGGQTLRATADGPHMSFAPRYTGDKPVRIPGVAKTAIDHAFDPDGVTGSLGFLCGLNPGNAKDGAAAARGYDPTGRFVGAKLRLAFR